MERKNILLSVLTIMLVPVFGFTQITKDRDVIASGGETVVTGSMQVSWTVGEVATNYFDNPNLMVSEGFQQSNLGGVGLVDDLFEGSISVYPNPVGDQLFYDIRTDNELELTVSLYDASGRLVKETAQFSVDDAYSGQIEMTGLAPGNWVLKIYSKDKELTRIFKVVKVK